MYCSSDVDSSSCQISSSSTSVSSNSCPSVSYNSRGSCSINTADMELGLRSNGWENSRGPRSNASSPGLFLYYLLLLPATSCTCPTKNRRKSSLKRRWVNGLHIETTRNREAGEGFSFPDKVEWGWNPKKEYGWQAHWRGRWGANEWGGYSGEHTDRKGTTTEFALTTTRETGTEIEEIL